MSSYNWPPEGSSGGGVTSLNSETGDVILVAGTGIDITPAGQNITISATGSVPAPGGLNTQIQYNNAGSFGGDTANTDGAGNISLTSIAASSLTVSRAVVTDGSKKLVSSATTAAEIGFVNGVTSAIQTQLNSKQATLTIGDLTDAGTDGITIGNGVGSVIGSGTTITQHVADSTHNGYLSSTDWSTFNNKGSGTVTAVSVASANGFAGNSSGGATPALTLSTTITGILSGNGTAISAATTTGSGAVVLATSATLVTPALGTPTALVGTNITGTAAGLTAGHVTTNANLTGDVTSSGNATTLATVNSNVGSFTNANITVNAKGLITAAANGSGGAPTAPLQTIYAGGASGNHTLTGSPLYITVELVGPGGGGQSSNGGSAGSAGSGSTTFDSLTGGAGGAAAGAPGGGAGGTATGGDINIPGQRGFFRATNGPIVSGGAGGGTGFGPGGTGGDNTPSAGNPGIAPGSGGGGAGNGALGDAASGGGGGGYVYKMITSPSGPYAYAVGTGGAGGTGGSANGGLAADGTIVIIEYYQ